MIIHWNGVPRVERQRELKVKGRSGVSSIVSDSSKQMIAYEQSF